MGIAHFGFWITAIVEQSLDYNSLALEALRSQTSVSALDAGMYLSKGLSSCTLHMIHFGSDDLPHKKVFYEHTADFGSPLTNCLFWSNVGSLHETAFSNFAGV
jgi:hypothetical protein